MTKKLWISSDGNVALDLDEVVACMWVDYQDGEEVEADDVEPDEERLHVWLRTGVRGDNAFSLDEAQGQELLDALTEDNSEPANPGPHSCNPDHDSLFSKFEQLDAHLERIQQYCSRPSLTTDARELAALIRAQVLK